MYSPMREGSVPASPLLSLPAELIQHILSFLTPIHLADVSRVCRTLRDHAYDDRLWHRHIQENVPGVVLEKQSTGLTFRQMYLQHAPYWFLPRHKIWFSDSPHHGKLIIIRYSAIRHCIEGYALVAERGHLDLEFWDYNPDVIIHTFSPKVQLHLDQPVIRINPASPRNFPNDDRRFQREIAMATNIGHAGAAALFSTLILSRPLPETAICPQTQVWPPLKIPAVQRTRNQSAGGFQTHAYRPSRLSEVSEHTFRVRKWMEFRTPGAVMPMRMGEDVNTYATLPAEAYTPTREKPWRGIWVGDYAGHGCEFLAILQPDEPVALPQGALDILQRVYQVSSLESPASWQTAPFTLGDDGDVQPTWIAETASTEWMDMQPQEQQNPFSHPLDRRTTDQESKGGPSSNGDQGSIAAASYSGQLLAVKLTGDPNVPRGEYTFVAPDIGPNGTVRIAQEPIFRGARVIRSCGHIASTGFIDDLYIPSQLILISENKIAQYWEAFGHVSFYQRVDIDKLIKCDQIMMSTLESEGKGKTHARLRNTAKPPRNGLES